MRKSKVYSISDEDFIALIQTSSSYSDCLRALGLGTKGGSSTDALKKRIDELKCSTKHFRTNNGNSPRCKCDLQDILVENSTYQNTSYLKSRILKAELLEYKCYECGLTEWRGKPLSLQLDHINGVNKDHRIDNLRFLCPNCHSQTDTYAGKNKN